MESITVIAAMTNLGAIEPKDTHTSRWIKSLKRIESTITIYLTFFQESLPFESGSVIKKEMIALEKTTNVNTIRSNVTIERSTWPMECVDVFRTSNHPLEMSRDPGCIAKGEGEGENGNRDRCEEIGPKGMARSGKSGARKANSCLTDGNPARWLDSARLGSARRLVRSLARSLAGPATLTRNLVCAAERCGAVRACVTTHRCATS